MDYFQDIAIDLKGAVQSNVQVAVSLNGSPATIYSDPIGTVSTSTLTTDANGKYSFFYNLRGWYTFTVNSRVVGEQYLTTGRMVDTRDFGARVNGSYDDASSIQAAANYCAANGLTLYSAAGTSAWGSQFNCPNNLVWALDPNAENVGYFATTGNNGFIAQADSSTKISTVYIHGGRFSKPNTTDAYQGRIFSLYGDDIRIYKPVVHTYGHGGVMFIGGNRVFVDGLKSYDFLDDVGVAGIRVFAGGASDGTIGVKVTNSHIECGDDCMQFVTADTGVRADLSIWNSSFSNCTGKSTQARLTIVGMGRNSTVNQHTCSYGHLSFHNIKGSAPNAALLQMWNSAGTITDVKWDDVDCTCVATSSSGYGVHVDVGTNNAGTALIDDVVFNGVDVDTPQNGNVIDGEGLVYNITLRDCDLGTPTAATTNGLIVKGVTGGGMFGGSVAANGNDTIVLSDVSSAAANDFNVEGVAITVGNGASAAYGVVAHSPTVGSTIRGNRFLNASGATNSRAVNWNSGATYVVAEENNVDALTSGTIYSFNANIGNCIKGRGTSNRLLATTDATPTTLFTCTVPNNADSWAHGYITARRQSGSAGSTNDIGVWRVEGAFTGISGTPNAVGFSVTAIGKSQAGWDVTSVVNGSNIDIQVTGAANNTVWWAAPEFVVRRTP